MKFPVLPAQGDFIKCDFLSFQRPVAHIFFALPLFYIRDCNMGFVILKRLSREVNSFTNLFVRLDEFGAFDVGLDNVIFVRLEDRNFTYLGRNRPHTLKGRGDLFRVGCLHSIANGDVGLVLSARNLIVLV